MSVRLRTTLMRTLFVHFKMSNSYLECMCCIILGIIGNRTVNLSHLTSWLPGPAKTQSKYRRLQRFFQYIRPDTDTTALLVGKMLRLFDTPAIIALDRTTWKVGRQDVNILVLCVITRRVRVPLLWLFLEHGGGSNIQQRIGLIDRFIALFGASSILYLLADREFVGHAWMKYLNDNNICFVIRIRKSMNVTLPEGGTWSLQTLLGQSKRRQCSAYLKGTGELLNFAAKKLSGGDLLVVATNGLKPAQALNMYRKRWHIECLFSDIKTRGFNMESTRMTNTEKLSALLVILTLALTWSYTCASSVFGTKSITRKKHGRKEKSWFRTGLDILKSAVIYDHESAIKAWGLNIQKMKRQA